MGSNSSTVKTPNVQATGLMANPQSSSNPPQSSSPIPFNQPYFTQQPWPMTYPQAYVQAPPAPVQANPPQQNSRQKPNQQQANGTELIHHHHVYPQVMANPAIQPAPVAYPVPQSQQPFPIWPTTNFTYVAPPPQTQAPPQYQESGKQVQQSTQQQQQQQQQQAQQTTDQSAPLLKTTGTNATQQTEGTQQQSTGQAAGQNTFVQLSQQKFAQPIDYSLPAPPKSFCPQYRAQPKVPIVAPLVPQQVQFPTMNVGLPYGYGGVQPAVFGQPMDYLGGFIQPPNPFGTCNQAFQAANNAGFAYQPIAQY